MHKWLSAQVRYEQDANFRQLVDLMTMEIERSHYTPTELREAVILAATRYEYTMTQTTRRYVDHYQGERKQDRKTPLKFFADWHAKLHFTLDGAATAENALLPRYSTAENPVSWEGERVFCNPPWSNIPPFLEFGPLAELAMFLVPARVNARWFHRALDLGGRPEFFKPKLKFDGLKDNSPTDCLLIFFERVNQ